MAKKDKKQQADPEQLRRTEPPRLQKRFVDEVRPKVRERFGVGNAMALPRFEKIVVNVNMGRHLENGKLPATVKETVLDTLVTISGQKPVVVKAKQSVSNFKLREGMESSAYVTLRRERMWDFLDRFVNLAAPRIRDFRGLPARFDRAGNYSMGVTEQGVFPEVDMTKTQFTHGMNINMVFSNSTPEITRFVLEELGMPFVKDEKKG